MTTILDEQLLLHAERVKGKVVVITGGANGIGKETALVFAKYGAKVVIGDISADSARGVVGRICKAGGQAISMRCNVLDWNDQVALFDLAVSTFGTVDIVIPLAGLGDSGDVCTGFLKFKDGKPAPPNLRTLEVNLIGVLHTTHLALHYFKHNRPTPDIASWKALTLIGSMASWEAIPGSALYTASKHALLGVMRSLYPLLCSENIRIAIITPWFAETSLVPVTARLLLSGTHLTPVPRIAHAILCSAADPNAETNGCPWVLPDGGPVLRLERENLTAGAYEILNDRIAQIRIAEGRLKLILILGNLWKIFGQGFTLALLLLGLVVLVRRYVQDV